MKMLGGEGDGLYLQSVKQFTCLWKNKMLRVQASTATVILTLWLPCNPHGYILTLLLQLLAGCLKLPATSGDPGTSSSNFDCLGLAKLPSGISKDKHSASKHWLLIHIPLSQKYLAFFLPLSDLDAWQVKLIPWLLLITYHLACGLSTVQVSKHWSTDAYRAHGNKPPFDQDHSA